MLITEETVVKAVDIASYVTLAGCVVGLLGNATCAWVMLNKRFRSMSSSVFLFWLVVADSAVLAVECLDDLSQRAWISPPLNVGEWSCRLTSFVGQTGRIAGSWLVVALAVEAARTSGGTSKSRGRALHVSMTVLLLSVAGAFPLLVITRVSHADQSVASFCTSKYAVFRRLYLHLVLSVGVEVIAPCLLIAVAMGKAVYVQLTSDKIAGDPLHNRHSANPSAQAVAASSSSTANGKWLDIRSGPMEAVKHKTSLTLQCVLAMCITMMVSLLPYAYVEVMSVSQGLKSPSPVEVSLSSDVSYAMSRAKSLPVSSSYHRERFLITLTRTLLLLNYAVKYFLLMAMDPRVRAATASLLACGKRDQSSSYRSSSNGHGGTSESRADNSWVTDPYDVTGKEVAYSIPADRSSNYDTGLFQ